MQLVDMLFDEIEDAKKRRVPFIIPIGTIEYHAHHASCGCDTMVINGAMREVYCMHYIRIMLILKEQRTIQSGLRKAQKKRAWNWDNIW